MENQKNENTSFLKCVQILGKKRGLTITQESLLGNLDKESFCQIHYKEVLKKIGYDSDSTSLKISALKGGDLFPIIIKSPKDKYCILDSIKDGKYNVIYGDGREKSLAKKDFLKLYAKKDSALECHSLYERTVFSYNAIFKNPKTKWFWNTLLKFKRAYRLSMMASLFINIFAVAVSLYTMNVYDRVIPNKAEATLWTLTLGIVIIFGFDLILKMLRSFFIDRVGQKVDLSLSDKLLSQSLNIPVHNKPSNVGIYVNNFKEFDQIRDFISSSTLTALIDIPFVFLFLFITYLIGGSLFIPAVFGIVLILTTSILISRRLSNLAPEINEINQEKSSILVETLSRIEEIKIFSAQGRHLNRFRKCLEKVVHLGSNAKFLSTLATNISGTCILMVNIMTVVWGTYLIMDNQITLGTLIGCSILNGRALAPLSVINGLLLRYQNVSTSLQGLHDFMDQPVERAPQKQFFSKEIIKGDIFLENVSFCHKNRWKGVFDDITLRIRPGEKIGILGKMGSGKSTFCQLMMGFYEVDKGHLFIDDVDIRYIDPFDLRKNIGYCGQFPKLFTGSIRQNITLKEQSISDEEMLELTKISGAHAFIKTLPLNYSTPLEENSHGLSGGQIQSLALARSMVGNPNILIWDEPTSGIDSKLEANFVKNVKPVIKDKTVIIATHKRDILELVDRIIIIDDGKIITDAPKQKIIKR